MDQAELSNVKSNLSLAYVRAIAAKLNFAFQEASRDIDSLGIDCCILNKGVGSANKYSMGGEIKLQVKAFSRSSTSMYRETDSQIEYKLNNELIPNAPIFYLVVVELPEEENFDEWLQVKPDHLILKKCAYFIRIKETVKAGFIKIPKSNRFSTETLPNMFITVTNKEDEI